MNIIVCMKQVVDPEVPPTRFKVDTENNRYIIPSDIPNVISPFDRLALEAALRVRDQHGGKITAISLGKNLNKNVVREAYELTADELITIDDENFSEIDSWLTAYYLTCAIKKIGAFDLIFCGRQASDTDGGQVGVGIAEMLGIPSVTLAKGIEIKGDKAEVERVSMSGFEFVETDLPALITVSNELGEVRYPSLKQVMMSKKKSITTWNQSNIIEEEKPIEDSRMTLVRLYKPKKDGQCTFIEGRNPEEAGVNLAVKLMEDELI